MVGLNVPTTSTSVVCTEVIQVEGMVSTISKGFVVLKRQVNPLKPVVFVTGGLALTGKVRFGPVVPVQRVIRLRTLKLLDLNRIFGDEHENGLSLI